MVTGRRLNSRDTHMGRTPHSACDVDPRKVKAMTLISLVVTLIVVGVLLWLVNTYIPMDGKIKKILNIVV